MNENVCHSKQKWNHDKCRCECEKLDDWGSCKNVYIWSIKGVCKKINCLIHTILLVIICSILVVIFIICYYYYTRDWTQKAHVVLN